MYARPIHLFYFKSTSSYNSLRRNRLHAFAMLILQGESLWCIEDRFYFLLKIQFGDLRVSDKTSRVILVVVASQKFGQDNIFIDYFQDLASENV